MKRWISGWFLHATAPHFDSIDPARLAMAAARFSSWPKRKVESCPACTGFIVRINR